VYPAILFTAHHTHSSSSSRSKKVRQVYRAQHVYTRDHSSSSSWCVHLRPYSLLPCGQYQLVQPAGFCRNCQRSTQCHTTFANICTPRWAKHHTPVELAPLTSCKLQTAAHACPGSVTNSPSSRMHAAHAAKPLPNIWTAPSQHQEVWAGPSWSSYQLQVRSLLLPGVQDPFKFVL
jgi:hypothetical protein